MTNPRLDPEIARFIALLNGDWHRHPPLDAMPVAQARDVAEQVRAPWVKGGPEMAHTQDIAVALTGGDLRLRVHRPQGVAAEKAPVLLYFHGGGFVYFSLDTHDRLMREYAAAGRFVVIGVDYPLSPEARYPQALDLIVTLVRWLEEHGHALGIDPARVALGGDSVGANLSLATCLKLRETGEAGRVRAILSNYGAFSDEVSDQAEADLGGPRAVLTRAEMAFYFGHYLRDAHDRQDPLACPLVATDLTDLPPTLFVIPELDVLREQSEAVAGRMKAAGGEVVTIVYPGATHSFLEAMSIAAVARRAIDDGARWVSRQLCAEADH